MTIFKTDAIEQSFWITIYAAAYAAQPPAATSVTVAPDGVVSVARASNREAHDAASAEADEALRRFREKREGEGACAGPRKQE